MHDTARFPSLSRYLTALPEGLSSYPGCRTKGAIVRSVFEEGMSLPEGLPEPLEELARSRPPLTAWVPAVHADALFHLQCDLAHLDEDGMLAWTYERTARVGRSQAYRHLLSAAGPRALLRTSVRMHGFFQQGTELDLHELTQNHAAMGLRYPAHLHSRLNLLSNVALLRALVELTGGQDVECAMTHQDPTTARYDVRWR